MHFQMGKTVDNCVYARYSDTMTHMRKIFLITFITLLAVVGFLPTAGAAKPGPTPWVSVADESPLDPSYDVLWGGPANVSASSRYVRIECDNLVGHLLFSETIDLTVASSVIMMGSTHPSEGDYYFSCVAELLSNNQRKVLATDPFIMHSV
jgi:hypothetical protein